MTVRKRGQLLPLLLLIALVGPILLRPLIRPAGRSFSGPVLREVRYQEIRFANKGHGIQLAGMLFVPEGPGPYPGAVVIHGSGTSRRDSVWYLTLAQYLQDKGVVVLLPDKRGSEQSQGDWRSASFEDLATDTVAAIEHLTTNAALPLSGVGVIGMSQGGWIAPIVADLSPDVRFVVSVVGAAVRPAEQLLYEENNNLRQVGLLPGLSHLLAYVSSLSIREVRQKQFWDAVGDFDPLPYWQPLHIPRKEEFADNSLSIVTFNYDRSLEMSLMIALRNSYGLYTDETEALLRTIPIVHAHGQLGALWQSEGLRRRVHRPDLDRETIDLASQGIKVIGEDRDDTESAFRDARKLIKEAEVIAFMGFGYHRLNIERLGFDEASPDAKLFGSAYHMGNAEIAEAGKYLDGRVTFANTSFDALRFLREERVLDY